MAEQAQKKLNVALRQQRRLRGWSLEEAARQIQALCPEQVCGISADMISKWELGKYTPSAFYQAKLCQLYQMTAMELGFMDDFSEALESSNDMNRRKAMQDIVTIAGTVFITPQDLLRPLSLQHLSEALSTISPSNSDALKPFRTLLDACWQFSQASELRAVEHILPLILSRTKPLAQQPSTYQRMAAIITSQSYRLAGLIALHADNLPLREIYCKDAVQYGEVAGDPDSLVTALMSLATTFFYAKRPRKALQTYQETLHSLEKVSPVVGTRIYIGLAEAHARCGQEQEALRYIGLAHETALEHPEAESNFLIADYGAFLLYEGLTHLHRHKPQDALDVFARVEEPSGRKLLPERILIEIINHQAEATLALNDQERFRSYLEAGVKGALALKSEKRFRESLAVYEKALAVWGHNSRIKALADLFVR